MDLDKMVDAVHALMADRERGGDEVIASLSSRLVEANRKLDDAIAELNSWRYEAGLLTPLTREDF